MRVGSSNDKFDIGRNFYGLGKYRLSELDALGNCGVHFPVTRNNLFSHTYNNKIKFRIGLQIY